MVLLGDKAQVKLVLVHLEIVRILLQNRCMVCAERNIGSENVLDTPDGTPRFHGSCGFLFRSGWTQCYCRCEIGARFAPIVP